MKMVLQIIRKRYSIILVLIAFVFQGYSQVPGYMGKKVVAGYGFYFHPSFGNMLYEYSDRSFNTLHELFLEYTTGKKFMLGASLRFFKYTNNNIESVYAYDEGLTYNYAQVDDSPEGTYTINGTNFMIYGKAFKKGYLAPWGKYFVFGLCFTRYKTTYDPTEMKVLFEQSTYNYNTNTYDVDQFYYSDFGPTTQNYKGFDLFFGNGKSRIFANSIVLDYGYTINVIAMSRVFVSEIIYPEENYSYNYIENTSKSRVASVNRFNFYIKLGYLF